MAEAFNCPKKRCKFFAPFRTGGNNEVYPFTPNQLSIRSKHWTKTRGTKAERSILDASLACKGHGLVGSGKATARYFRPRSWTGHFFVSGARNWIHRALRGI